MADDVGKPVRLEVTVEAVVEVVDAHKLTQAAITFIDSVSYTDDTVDPETGMSEEESDRARARDDVADAFSLAFDPADGMEAVEGVEFRESTVSVGVVGAPRRLQRPDFSQLFAGQDVTPRAAAVLWYVLGFLSDMAYDDVERFGDEPVHEDQAWALFDRYPRTTHRQDAVWRRQAARAFDDLVADIEAGEPPEPRSFGEEMALHLALEDAPGEVADLWEVMEEVLERLPSSREDFDWNRYSDILFQDHDILALFHAELDGIEDPDADLNRSAGIGELRPNAWFVPFLNVEPRDGRRPFRR